MSRSVCEVYRLPIHTSKETVVGCSLRGGGEDLRRMEGEEAILGILYERRIKRKRKKNIILTLLQKEIDKLILPLMSSVTVHESGTGRQSYV